MATNPVKEMGDLILRAKRIGFDIREPGSLTEMRNFVKDVEAAARRKRVEPAHT